MSEVSAGQKFRNISVLKVDGTARLAAAARHDAVEKRLAGDFKDGPPKRLAEMNAETKAMKRHSKFFTNWRPGSE